MSYAPPQVSVNQIFTTVPAALDRTLHATIVGPRYQVVQYPADKATGLLGAYTDDAEHCFSWPNRSPGAVVDHSWLSVWLEDAYLQYFHNPASTGDIMKSTYCSSQFLWEDNVRKNLVHAATTNFRTFGAYARDAALYERDVQIGDVARIQAVVGVETVTLWTTVSGFISDVVPGFTAAATADDNNQTGEPTSSSLSSGIPEGSASWSEVGTVTNNVAIAAAGLPAMPVEQCYVDGVSRDSYRIEVVTGGDYTDAVLRVTSDSGLDDVVELTASAFGAATAFGTRGVSITFNTSGGDVFEAGQAWLLDVYFGFNEVTVYSSGTYTGPSDTTYIATVTRGGLFGSATPPQVTISTSTGIDVSGPHDVTPGALFAIGTYGVQLYFDEIDGASGLYAGDRFYVACTAATAGAERTLVLAHNLPDELLGIVGGVCTGAEPTLSVTLYIKKTMELTENRTGFAPLVNWEASATEICLQDGAIGYDETWINGSGVQLPLPIRSATAYVQYRALMTSGANQVLTIADATAADTELGVNNLYNPIRYGVGLALANSSGVAVKAVMLATDDLAGYQAAIDCLTERDDVYGVTPMTFNTSVQDAAKAHALALSTAEAGRWRRAYLSTPLTETLGILTATGAGAPVLAKISEDSGTSGMQYTIVEVTTTGVDLVVAGVRAGDILRTGYTTDGFGSISYSEYVVDALLSGDSLRLVSGPAAPVTVASKIEIWRNLSTEQQVDQYLLSMGRFANRRVTNVMPDYYESADSSAVPGYYLAAAYAGRRSAVTTQQSLTGSTITGPTGVSRLSRRFSYSQLNRLAGGGNALIVQDATGRIYVRHALTTDMSDLNAREEMKTVNGDFVSYYLLDTMVPFIGVSNNVPSARAQMENELKQAVSILKQIDDDRIGGHIVDAVVGPVEQHPVLLDRVIVTVTPEWPYPTNNIDVTLVI